MIGHLALIYIGFVMGVTTSFAVLIWISERYPERMTWFVEDYDE